MTTTLPAIIDPESLQQCLKDKARLTIIDVRAKADYLKQHHPDAVHFDITQANHSEPPINGLLPKASVFEHALSEIGVTLSTPIIIIDESAGPPAGRLAWTLAAFGHEQVSILNGGMRAWIAESRPCRTGDEIPAPQQFISSVNKRVIATSNEILQKLNDPAICIVDARSAAEFRGDDSRSKHGGHIPGAINLDWTLLKANDNSGYFKPMNEIQAILTRLGITADKEVISYCQTHQRSALLWVVLKHLAYKNNKGYPGAWSDWGNSDALPVER